MRLVFFQNYLNNFSTVRRDHNPRMELSLCGILPKLEGTHFGFISLLHISHSGPHPISLSNYAGRCFFSRFF